MEWGSPSRRRDRLSAALAGLVLASCTPTEPRPASSTPEPSAIPRGGTVVFGLVGDVSTLDPYSPRASDLTYALVRPIYPSLFRFDPDGIPQPYLARAVERTASRATVELRPMRWSDGTAITARDVVASWRRAAAPSGFARIGRARASGRHEVTFSRVPARLALALATVAYVLPRGSRRSGRAGGPWTIARRVPGLEVVYRPNPEWVGDPPGLDRVIVRSFEATEPLLAQLEAGRIDAAWVPATVNLPDRLDELDLQHAETLGWESVALAFVPGGTTRAERVAIGRAIDRHALDEAFVRDLGRVSDTLHPGPGPGGASGPWGRLRARGERPEDGLSIAIPTGDELLFLIAGAMRVQARGARIGLEPAGIDHRTFYGDRSGLPVAAFLERRAGAPGIGGTGRARRELLAFPLLHVANVLAWRFGVEGLEPNPTFDGPLWNLHEWFLTTPP